MPEHGAVGSAWATVGARVFLSGALLICIFLMREGAIFGVRKNAGVGPGYGALLTVGAPAAVSQAAEAGAFQATNVIAGRLGPSVVSTYGIMLNLMAIVFMVALGLAAATAVLVSEAIGRQAPHDAARAGWTGIGLNAIAMVMLFGLGYAYGRLTLRNPWSRGIGMVIVGVALVALTKAFGG